MALVRCKNCDYQVAVGCMPTATCGLLMLVGLAVGAGSAGGIASGWLKTYSLWIRICGGILAFLTGGVVGVFGIHFIPWTLEWLFAMCHRCPECGQREWSYPFTRGFGL